MDRRLLPLLLLAGCGGAPVTQRLLDGDHEARGLQVPTETVLFDAAAPDAPPWHAVLGLKSSGSALDSLRAHSGVGSDGSVEMRAANGGHIAFLEVDPGTAIELGVTLTLANPGAAEATAQVGLVELEAMPAEPDDAAALMIETHWGPSRKGAAGGDRVHQILHLTPRTRAVGVVLSVRCEGADDTAPPTSRFEEVRVLAAGPQRLLADLTGDRAPLTAPERPFTGRFSIGLTEREGVAVLPETSLETRVTLPDLDARLELQAGMFALGGAPGRAAVELSVFFEPDEGPHVSVIRKSFEVDAERVMRWQDLTTQLPAEVLGERGVLRFRIDGDAPGWTAVLAGLRVVPDTPRRAGPNVVVVSIDTLRADRVGCYGYERDTTPNLDAFASTARLFEQVWSQGAYTLPSHMSIFTGQFATIHGVQDGRDARDPERSQLLAEILSERGYATAAFTGGAYVHPSFGFGAGFDQYGSVDPAVDPDGWRWAEMMEALPGVDKQLARDNSVDAVGEWLDAHREEPFLLFFHTYAAHEFSPARRHMDALGLTGALLQDDPLAQAMLGSQADWPDPLPAGAFERLSDLYDGGVYQADEALGKLLAHLTRLELDGDTIVVITSDHGKEIGDHGGVGHGHTVYEEMIRVPLLIRVPGATTGREALPVMTIDILPTILAALDIPVPANVQGQDLFDEVEPRLLYSELDHLALKSALRRGSIKTIHGPLDAEVAFPNTVAWEAFDLELDPLEQAPLDFDERYRRAHETFQSRLEDLAAQFGRRADGTAEVSDEQRSLLDALGYTGELED